MEYRPISGGDYIACDDGSTTVGPTGCYLVRYAETATSAASPDVIIYVPPYNTHSVSGTVKDSSDNAISGATVKVMRGIPRLALPELRIPR